MTNQTIKFEQLLTVEDLARLEQTSEKTIRRRLAAGKLRYIQIGRMIRTPASRRWTWKVISPAFSISARQRKRHLFIGERRSVCKVGCGGPQQPLSNVDQAITNRK